MHHENSVKVLLACCLASDICPFSMRVHHGLKSRQAASIGAAFDIGAPVSSSHVRYGTICAVFGKSQNGKAGSELAGAAPSEIVVVPELNIPVDALAHIGAFLLWAADIQNLGESQNGISNSCFDRNAFSALLPPVCY